MARHESTPMCHSLHTYLSGGYLGWEGHAEVGISKIDEVHAVEIEVNHELQHIRDVRLVWLQRLSQNHSLQHTETQSAHQPGQAKSV